MEDKTRGRQKPEMFKVCLLNPVCLPTCSVWIESIQSIFPHHKRSKTNFVTKKFYLPQNTTTQFSRVFAALTRIAFSPLSNYLFLISIRDLIIMVFNIHFYQHSLRLLVFSKKMEAFSPALSKSSLKLSLTFCISSMHMKPLPASTHYLVIMPLLRF